MCPVLKHTPFEKPLTGRAHGKHFRMRCRAMGTQGYVYSEDEWDSSHILHITVKSVVCNTQT